MNAPELDLQAQALTVVFVAGSHLLAEYVQIRRPRRALRLAHGAASTSS